MNLIKKIAILAAISVVVQASAGRAWENPSERYTDAYKQYINAACPLVQDYIHHFVYFSRDREAIHDHALLTNDRFEGAQIMYAWRQLEPSKGQYDFSAIQADYEYLVAHGKRLFIQLQDATFSPKRKCVPGYLLAARYDGGVAAQYTDAGEVEGWVAKRWNAAVQARFALLLAALGKQFDGKVEGINLQESSIGVSHKTDPSFTPDLYVEGLKHNMRAMKDAFPNSATMQYANFIPGEWLPWEDRGYLKSIYSYGEEIGVGLGAPDLMFKRKGQLNHPLAMMHEHEYTTPLGVAIQDGNYIGKTNTVQVEKERKSIVPLLHVFAKDFLKVDYMFWGNQEPYFEQDVLPCFTSE